MLPITSVLFARKQFENPLGSNSLRLISEVVQLRGTFSALWKERDPLARFAEARQQAISRE